MLFDNSFQVSSWVTNIGEEFLTVHTNLGLSSIAAKEFCEDHGQLMDELKVTIQFILSNTEIFTRDGLFPFKIGVIQWK